MGSGYDVAERMGLLPRLRGLHAGHSGVAYVDRHGRRRSRLDYQAFAGLARGRMLTLMRGDLERVLFDALGGRVALRFGRSIAALAHDEAAGRVVVELDDGTRERADLLVGADGIHSRVRVLAFGPRTGS